MKTCLRIKPDSKLQESKWVYYSNKTKCLKKTIEKFIYLFEILHSTPESSPTSNDCKGVEL